MDFLQVRDDYAQAATLSAIGDNSFEIPSPPRTDDVIQWAALVMVMALIAFGWKLLTDLSPQFAKMVVLLDSQNRILERHTEQLSTIREALDRRNPKPEQ